MPHDIQLVKRGAEPGLMHRRFEDGELRASIHFLYGRYSSMGVRHSEDVVARSETLSPVPDPLYCVMNPMSCTGALLHSVGSVISSQDVARYVAMAFCTVQNGQQGDYERHLLDRMEDRADSRVAAAIAYGAEDFNFVVEVVGDEWSDVVGRVRDLTETPLVQDAHVCVTTGEHTRGFGSEASKLP